MRITTRRAQTAVLVLLALLVLAAGTGCGYRLVDTSRSLRFDTQYQVVAFGNSQVWIGGIDGFGASAPMRNVYYVRPVVREVYWVSFVSAGEPPNRQRAAEALLSRTQEGRVPGYGVISADDIHIVEPVNVPPPNIVPK